MNVVIIIFVAALILALLFGVAMTISLHNNQEKPKRANKVLAIIFLASLLVAAICGGILGATKVAYAEGAYTIKVNDSTPKSVSVTAGTQITVYMDYTTPDDAPGFKVGCGGQFSSGNATLSVNNPNTIGSGTATATFTITEAPLTKATLTVTPKIADLGQTNVVTGDPYTIELVPSCNGNHVKGASTSTPATCTEPEKIHYTCTLCGYQWDEIGSPALGHDYGPWSKLNDQQHEHHCQRHGCSAQETQNHTYGEPQVVPATDTIPGTRTYTCTAPGCGYQKVEEIPATGHVHSYNKYEVVKPATCEEDGEAHNVCECGQFTTVKIPKLGHKFEKEVERKDATCKEVGYVVKACTNPGCDKTQRTELPKLTKHTAAKERANVKAATCTTPGYSGDIVCVCGELMSKGTETPALGHTMYRGKCTRCGYTEGSSEVKRVEAKVTSPEPTEPPRSSLVPSGTTSGVVTVVGTATGAAQATNTGIRDLPAQTADEFNYALWIVLAVVGLAGASGCIYGIKKNKV